MNSTLHFDPLIDPKRWTGRYNRIAGKEPVFKARANNSAFAYWSPWKSNERLTSEFIDGPAVRHMVRAINHAKNLHAGQPGGAFQINEFGQVVCPLSTNSERYWVGTIRGVPSFADPRNGSTFELRLPASTKVATPWDRPYVGMKFNLDHNDSIYFREDDGDMTRKNRLGKSCPELVRRLRQVRHHGNTIRFIVNLHGVVLTKKEPDWEPVFVGHIDFDHWFSKEQ